MNNYKPKISEILYQKVFPILHDKITHTMISSNGKVHSLEIDLNKILREALNIYMPQDKLRQVENSSPLEYLKISIFPNLKSSVRKQILKAIVKEKNGYLYIRPSLLQWEHLRLLEYHPELKLVHIVE